MSDLDVAASNAADEQESVVETNVTQTIEAPSEPSPVSKSNTEALDRAFEQVAQEPEVRAVQNRKPDGKFAKGKTEVKQEEPAQAAEAAAPQTPEAQPAPVQAQAPNFGFSKEAQAEWGKVPEAVRKDVERRFTELTQGIEKHREAAQEFENVRYFSDWARSGGTDLKTALTAYTNIETMLRKEPARGFLEICKNMGVDPADVGQMLIQAAQGQPAQMQQPQQRYLTPEEARALARQEAEAFYTERDALSMVQKFRADHPRFDELEEDITGMLAHPRIKALPVSERLKAAYEAAERLNPAAPTVATPATPQTPAATTTTQAVQTAAPDPKTKEKARLSITGSPDGGSNPANRKIPGSTGEALDNAFARVGL